MDTDMQVLIVTVINFWRRFVFYDGQWIRTLLLSTIFSLSTAVFTLLKGIYNCKFLCKYQVGETLLKLVVGDSAVPTPSSDVLESVKPPGSENSPDSKLNKDTVGGVLATPAVRNLAKLYGINLYDVDATGKDGRVLKEDVLKYAVQKGAADGPSTASVSADCREQLLGEEETYPQTFAEVKWYPDDKTVPLR